MVLHLPDRVEYVRFDVQGNPVQESRSDHFEPGVVLARFAPGAVDLADRRIGTIQHFRQGDVRAIMEQFGMLSVERLYDNASQDDQWITSRTGRVVKAINLWDVYVLRFQDNAPVWEIVDSLRTIPQCVYAEPNCAGQSCSAPNDTLYKYKHRQWNIDNVRLPNAWDLQGGGGYTVGIGILDTGIDYNHIDLGQGWGEGYKIRGGWNYIDDTWDFMDDADTSHTQHDSHGTLVTGIAGALTNNHHGMAGVAGGWAPGNLGCALFGLKTSNYLAVPEFEALAEAINDYSLNDYGVDIFNASCTIFGYSETVNEALINAYIADRVFVASKGNDGTSDLEYPADYDGCWVVCVGGSDRPGSWPDQEERRHVQNGYLSSSDYGQEIDLLAPSVELWSTNRKVHVKKYREVEGTSGAAPHVSGIAGLLLSECDTLCAEDVQGLLIGSCVDILHDEDADPFEDLTGYDEWSGWGRVDARKALEFLSEPWSLRSYRRTGGSIVWSGGMGYRYFAGDLPPNGWVYSRAYKVRCDVTYPVQYDEVKHVWGRGYGRSTGWSGYSPCYQIGYCRVLPETIAPTGCTVETWVYREYTVMGTPLDWFPCHPSDVEFEYRVLGRTCASVGPTKPGLETETAVSVRVYANPARDGAKASFTLAKPGEVTVEMYDVRGNFTSCVARQYFDRGNHTVAWDGSDNEGRPAAPGVYVLRITSGGEVRTAKVVMVR